MQEGKCVTAGDLQDRYNRLKNKYTALAIEHARALDDLARAGDENRLLEGERNYLRAKIEDILKKVGFDLTDIKLD